MATVEHCVFCFETLAAQLEDREPMTLAEVEKSWAEFNSSSANPSAASQLTKRLPALRRLAGSSSSSSSSSNSSAGTPGSLAASSSSSSASSTASLPQPAAGTSHAATPATSVSSLAPTPPPPPAAQPPAESPLFVTWNTVSTRHGHEDHSLRGCIGTFEPQPLEDGLAAYALAAALQDTRFAPVAAREMPTLAVAVTLLTDFEDRGGDAMDWELGTHGLRISFTWHGRRYGATYLPDVAPEQGWTKEETVISLMRKAGWLERRKDRWREVDLKVVRYQGRKIELEYAEYKRWRDWVDKEEES